VVDTVGSDGAKKLRGPEIVRGGFRIWVGGEGLKLIKSSRDAGNAIVFSGLLDNEQGKFKCNDDRMRQLEELLTVFPAMIHPVTKVLSEKPTPLLLGRTTPMTM
jgi:hypothetical protein